MSILPMLSAEVVEQIKTGVGADVKMSRLSFVAAVKVADPQVVWESRGPLSEFYQRLWSIKRPYAYLVVGSQTVLRFSRVFQPGGKGKDRFTNVKLLSPEERREFAAEASREIGIELKEVSNG